MKFFLSVILIAFFSAIAGYLMFMPWWAIGVASFLVTLIRGDKPGRAFLAGFLGVALFWLTVALVHDIPNEHILSSRMAALFHLPDHWLFMLVTVIVGGLVGGLAAWAAALLRYNPAAKR